MYKVGQIVESEVTNIKHYGFFFITPDKVKGLVHISEVSESYVHNVEDFVAIGDKVQVKVMAYDAAANQIKGTMKNIGTDTSENKSDLKSSEGFDQLKSELPKMTDEAKNSLDND